MKDYKEYPDALYPNRRLFQKRVESEAVCELNDKLHINIFEWDHSEYADVPLGYEVEITAEKNGMWWELKCYGLHKKDLDRLDEIEKTLIKLFNEI